MYGSIESRFRNRWPGWLGQAPVAGVDSYFRSFNNTTFWWNGTVWTPLPRDPYITSVSNVTNLDRIATDNYYNPGTAASTNGFRIAGGAISIYKTMFGGPSVLIDNAQFVTGAAALSAKTDAAYNYAAGDFTIEFWYYPNAVSGASNLWDQRTLANSIASNIYTTGDDIRYFVSNADRITGGAGSVVVNTWQHIVICRVSGNTRLFVNGVQKGSTYVDGNTYIQGAVTLGNSNILLGLGAAPANAYFQCPRITKGVGRYPAAFIAPTMPWSYF